MQTQNATLEIISPKTVAGLSFIYLNGEKKIIYRGLEFSLSEKDYPFIPASDIILNSIEKARVSDSIIKDKNENLIISDVSNSGAFNLCVGKDGSILSISSPANNFFASFSNYRKK